MKHCVLILAHHNFEQLQLLLSSLDDERFDIYVHIDKKVSLIPNLSCKNATLLILQHKIDVRWGDFSQIQAELQLFESSFKNGPYKIYHLISGVDFPIKSVDYIYNFVEQHPKTEFIGFSNDKKEKFEDKILKYHFFTRSYKSQNLAQRFLLLPIRFISEFLVNLFATRSLDMELKKGANWVSLTHNCVGYLLSKKDFINKKFKYSCCADEIYKQTLIWNSPFKHSVYFLEDEFKGAMRLIDWERGEPYLWGASELDIKLTKESDGFFVRKTDIRKYPEFLHELYKMISCR